ncbi:MAG: UPF0262 family protein [Polyangiaceae bacterium]
MGNLADLRIDEPTWESGTPLRRAEWKSTCDDLRVECNFGDAVTNRHVLVSSKPAVVLFEVLDDEGFAVTTFEITQASLQTPITEYLVIIRRMDDNAQDRDASWFEAVDMAKKVVHDRAARVLLSSVPELSSDLGTLRKIFTLVLSLFVDTTTLHHARGHGFRRSQSKTRS